MCKETIKYPVGEQSFEELRKAGYLYVDKTQYIEKLVKGSKYYFLGRPRRFGKSLFLSALKCFFEGKRELFKDLYIDSVDWNWEEYPVIYIDLNDRRYKSEEKLDLFLEEMISFYENLYGIERPETDFSGRFGNLIIKASEKTGRKVVILVDEYDKPLVNNIHDKQKFEEFRNQLAEIYSHFKSKADYLRLVFITGVSRFGKLSIFSGFNNPMDISMVNDFSAICGITKEELVANFSEGIRRLAEDNDQTEEEALAELKQRYDGYHFSPISPDIYNPFSLLNVFATRMYRNYWISSGTPSLLVEQLKRTRADLSEIMETKSGATALEGMDISNIKTVPLLFQTGYLTIKKVEARGRIFRLGLPNDEVKEGFLEYLLPAYATLHREDAELFIFELKEKIESGEVEDFMKLIVSLFSGTGYQLKMEEELNVQNALYIVFKLIGMFIDTEYRTSDGRIDILMRTADYVYIMELKFDKTASEALEQIRRKEYALQWSIDNRQVIAIGVNFSTEKRRIDDWTKETINF